MKKNLIILMLFVSLTCNAQQLRIGWGSASFNNHALNNFIYHYNDGRPWLKNELGGHNLINGLSVMYNTLDQGNFGYMVGVTSFSRRTSAAGTTPTGIDIKRKLNSRLFTMTWVGVSAALWKTDNLILELNVLPFQTTWYSVKTRLEEDEDWTHVTKGEGFLSTWMSGTVELNALFKVNAVWFGVGAHWQKGYLGPEYNLLPLEFSVNSFQSVPYDTRLMLDNFGITLFFAPPF